MLIFVFDRFVVVSRDHDLVIATRFCMPNSWRANGMAGVQSTMRPHVVSTTTQIPTVQNE